MSRHEGVSCDSCLKSNFRGRRYKCLQCYDYDLCATCYEAKATTTRHEATHAMQCILTRADFDLYYGGDSLCSDNPQSLTCPYCGKMGFTETTLHEHASSDHSDSTSEVVCPVCAAHPGGDPNHMTDDLTTHLNMVHRGTARDLFDDALGGAGPGGGRLSNRRTPLSSARLGSRTRRHTPGGAAQAARDMDPIAELLSHLSGRRVVAGTPQQLRELQMQLEMERDHARVLRDHLQRQHRVSRVEPRIFQPSGESSAHTNSNTSLTAAGDAMAAKLAASAGSSSQQQVSKSQYLLANCADPALSEKEEQAADILRAERALFVQDLFLSTLTENLQMGGEEEGKSATANPLSSSLKLPEDSSDNEESDSSPHESVS